MVVKIFRRHIGTLREIGTPRVWIMEAITIVLFFACCILIYLTV